MRSGERNKKEGVSNDVNYSGKGSKKIGENKEKRWKIRLRRRGGENMKC